MRNQLRNTNVIAYSNISDTLVEIKDFEGNYTGELVNTYESIKHKRVVISYMSGTYSGEHSGMIYTYEVSLQHIGKPTLREGALVWINSQELSKSDYKVKKVLPSLNSTKYILETNKESISNHLIPNVNLLKLDLTNTIDLGDNVYQVFDEDGISISFNAKSGKFTIDGKNTGEDIYLKNFFIPRELFNKYSEKTIQYYYEDGTFELPLLLFSVEGESLSVLDKDYLVKKFDLTNEDNYFIILEGQKFDNFEFKLKIEEGSRGTPYTPPRID